MTDDDASAADDPWARMFDGIAFETPVVLVVFNRPEATQTVFDRIARAEPPELLIVADGPRETHPDDEERCAKTRAITEEVSWECTVHRNYAETNLGLTRRIQTGLDWAFDRVDEAIILEDDCVPNASFFRFCQTMLEAFRGDERVMDVSGSNHLETWKAERQDYHLTAYGGIWGWATWADAWAKYDPDMRLWPDPEIQARVRDYIADDQQFAYLRRLYQETYDGVIDTWDYPWGFARAINGAYTAAPAKNLVSNVGFGADATHTTSDDSPIANVPRHELEFPIEMNDFVMVDREYDRAYYELSNSLWERNPLLRRVRNLGYRLAGREGVGG